MVRSKGAWMVGLMLVSAAAGCSASVEVLATVDSRGTPGAQVALDFGVAVTSGIEGRQLELVALTGVVIDEATSALAGVGVVYEDAHVVEGVGQRVGVFFQAVPRSEVPVDTPTGRGEADPSLLGAALTWAMTGTLTESDGGVPHTGYRWRACTQLGVGVMAAWRGAVSEAGESRAVFGVGPRLQWVTIPR